MSVFKKGAGLLRVVYKSNLKTAPKKVSVIGKYYPFNDGLDAYQWFEVEGLPATPTEKEFLEGNPDRLSYYVPSDITDIIPPLGVLFPNCTVYVVGNTEQVVSGLPDADAVAIVPNTLKSSYLADPVYSTYQNLTFDSWIFQNETTIPFVGNTTLTASFVRLFYENAGGIASTVGKIIVAPEYTDFETGVFDLIFALFVNCQEIEYTDKPYAKVEYISSDQDRSQYIDTGVAATNTTGVSLQAKLNVNLINQVLIGALEPGVGRFQPYYYSGDRALVSAINLAGTSLTLSSSGHEEIHLIEYNVNNRSVLFDGISKGNVENIGSTSKTIYLFCRNYNTTGDERLYSNARIYSCKLYDNSILVRDFVPCYRKSNGEIGLYDTVNGVFYTNKGTGVFLKGADTGESISEQATIQRPSVSTATILGSGTLTAQMVADTLTAYPEFASAERVIVPDDFLDYEAGALDEIFESFPNMTDLETPWVSGPTNYLGFTIPYDGTQSSVDKAYVQRYIDLLLKDDSVRNKTKKVTIAEGFAPPGQWQTYAGVFSSSDALDPCKELGMVEVEVKSPSVSYY